MRKASGLVAAILICAVCSTVSAIYTVSDKGEWPADWPKELDPIRAQASTYVGPMVQQSHFLIPFTKRAEFEAAWPHFLTVKSQGAPIFLLPGPKADFMVIKPAGVIIHSPDEADKKANPEAPIAGVADPRMRWMNTTFIELIVDGEVVDLNRIALPKDTPIIDERFKTQERTPTAKSGD